jgi:3-hydroxybutyryl-CoA dehydrogenase
MPQIRNPKSEIPNPKSGISKVGIIGEGKMGTGIFNYLVDFDLDLVWVCSAEADADKISRQFGKKIKRALDAGIIDKERFEYLQGTLISKDLNSVHDCDLIIEAIPELLALKKDMFVQLDKIVKPGAIFASNSSSINPSELFPASRRSGNFMGLHFFYPVPLKNIVEVTVTKDTTDLTLNAIESFLNHIGRRFITLDEKNSFMLNRIFLDFQNEAFLIVQSGRCNYLQMDQLVKNHLFPFGVFDFIDSVGLDTMLSSILNYTRDYPQKSCYSRLIETLSLLVSHGKLGLKTHEGFYKYPMEDIVVNPAETEGEIVDYLRQTWLSSAKRFTMLAHLPIDDANYAIKEYFDIARGPFG